MKKRPDMWMVILGAIFVIYGLVLLTFSGYDYGKDLRIPPGSDTSITVPSESGKP